MRNRPRDVARICVAMSSISSSSARTRRALLEERKSTSPLLSSFAFSSRLSR
ncbi:uncharacterized protein SOCEGT47_029190 [Sorangium cellulosum]|uniref:Uncharacterized protein n=1 Tax=Sorangium cellulosum TaxID=56 RepID=A0A4P2Q0K1_SORCE|nr:uncharacterized protein SOCEGT47_029190 [Sorangium cellulosum]